jgi:hypothetical protein
LPPATCNRAHQHRFRKPKPTGGGDGEPKPPHKGAAKRIAEKFPKLITLVDCPNVGPDCPEPEHFHGFSVLKAKRKGGSKPIFEWDEDEALDDERVELEEKEAEPEVAAAKEEPKQVVEEVVVLAEHQEPAPENLQQPPEPVDLAPKPANNEDLKEDELLVPPDVAQPPARVIRHPLDGFEYPWEEDEIILRPLALHPENPENAEEEIVVLPEEPAAPQVPPAPPFPGRDRLEEHLTEFEDEPLVTLRRYGYTLTNKYDHMYRANAAAREAVEQIVRGCEPDNAERIPLKEQEVPCGQHLVTLWRGATIKPGEIDRSFKERILDWVFGPRERVAENKARVEHIMLPKHLPVWVRTKSRFLEERTNFFGFMKWDRVDPELDLCLMSAFYNTHELAFIDIEVAEAVALHIDVQSRLFTTVEDGKVLASCYSLIYKLAANLFKEKHCDDINLMNNTKHYLANLVTFMAASQHSFMAADIRPENWRAALKRTALPGFQ